MEKLKTWKKVCKNCNNEFPAYMKRRVFCCKECSNAYNVKEQTKRRAKQRKPKTCKRCNASFYGLNPQRYCDPCINELNSKPIKQNKKVSKPKIEIIHCKTCSAKIEKTTHNKLYCDKCAKYRKIDDNERRTKTKLYNENKRKKRILDKIKNKDIKKSGVNPYFLKRGNIQKTSLTDSITNGS